MNRLPAIIPAAGRGTRLRPITRYLSKPMLPVGSEPVISYVLEEALRAGCGPVVVVVAPDDEDLKHYLRTTYSSTVRIAPQPEPRGLADAALRGYDTLDESGRCALMLPDNVVLNGDGIGSLLGSTDSDRLVLGTTSVTRTEAAFFGNSGRYEAEPVDDPSGVERILRLQEKGTGTFENAADSWPVRRAVARTLVPPEFFERAREADPDPGTGEVDDVPIYRAMIESSVVYGVALDGDIYDIGTPERYRRLNGVLFDRTDAAADLRSGYDTHD